MAVVSAIADSSNSVSPFRSASAAACVARVQADFPSLARFIPRSEDGKDLVFNLSKDEALAAYEELIKNMGSIDEPIISFVIFDQICLGVDKLIIGGPNDPTQKIMQLAADEAPPAFWKSAKDSSISVYLGQFLTRCRSLISVFSRHKNFEPTVPILQVLTRINLTEDLVAKFNLLDVFESVASQSDNADASALAKRLVKKFQKLRSNSNNASSATAAPKLFGSSGALKLHTGKRSREPEDQDIPTPNTKTTERSSDETQPGVSKLEVSTPVDSFNEMESEENDESTKPRKKAKTNKRVHWKPESNLVEVRFYEMDGEPKFKSRSARFQEVEEATQFVPPLIEWSTPKPIDFSSLPAQFRGAMSIKRGGLLNPTSPEAETQSQRESKVPRAVYADFLGTPIPDSPKEPTNPADVSPESSWVPRQGEKFIPAKPSALWLEKHGDKQNQQHPPGPLPNPAMANPMVPGMNPMMGMGMNGAMPPMMHGFGWGMNPMMGMMPPPQMNDLYKMNSMFGKPDQG